MKSHLVSALAGLFVVVALAVATVSGQYTMTVSQDRLRNAQNESQNWQSRHQMCFHGANSSRPKAQRGSACYSSLASPVT